MKTKIFTLFATLCLGTIYAQDTIRVYQNCTVQVAEEQRPTIDTENGHEYVDLGLSVKWATCNVGATTPEGYGDYFAWGETTTKSTYNWSTYFDTNDEGSTFVKYNNNGETTLELTDDAAHVNWGGDWRMPTQAEWQELLDNCTWERTTTQNGIYGYQVTSKVVGYTDKSIFLPAAGERFEGDLYSKGSNGYYWSSSLNEDYSDRAWSLHFDLANLRRYSYYRCSGHSVRPILP